jgi:AcrR family transcriptional regulator
MPVSKARKAIVTAVMRDTIFDAVGVVIEEHGVGGVTLDRVATTAGLTAGSLYNYFRNKDDLLQFVYTKLVEPFLQAIEPICRPELPAIQKVRKILDTACECAVPHKGLIRYLAEEDQSGQVRGETHPRVLRLLTAVFEQGVRDGSLRPHDPAHAGRIFQGSMTELFDLHQGGASGDEMNKYVEAVTDTMCRSFALGTEQSPKPKETSPRPSNP